MTKGLLIFFCGKMGAGKTTLARKMVKEKQGILISEDDLLSTFYPNKISTVHDYKKHSDLIKPVVENLVQQLLEKGLTVILDFPANTRNQRHWLKSISDGVDAPHICFVLDVADDVCLQRVLERAHPHTDTEEMFTAMGLVFVDPKDEEGVTVKRVEPSSPMVPDRA
ncbi:MAG: ATP-binding protein [Alphaproteobacteria bacterium]|nr:ATP-binding protein [Alphaproteobacteria bacterium]